MRTEEEIQELLEKEEKREATLESYFKRKREVDLFTKKNMKQIAMLDCDNNVPIDLVSSGSDDEKPSR